MLLALHTVMVLLAFPPYGHCDLCHYRDTKTFHPLTPIEPFKTCRGANSWQGQERLVAAHRQVRPESRGDHKHGRDHRAARPEKPGVVKWRIPADGLSARAKLSVRQATSPNLSLVASISISQVSVRSRIEVRYLICATSFLAALQGITLTAGEP